MSPDHPTKNNTHHGGAVCRVQRHGCCGSDKTLPVPSSQWGGRGRCRTILFNYVNRLRKKLISKLINFILYLLYSQLNPPPKRWYRISPTRPARRTSPPYSPPSRLSVFGWLLCLFTSFYGHLRPRRIFIFVYFCSSVRRPKRRQHAPHTLPAQRASSPTSLLPRTPTPS